MLHISNAHARGVLSVSVSPCPGGALVCSSSYDQSIKLWSYSGATRELNLLHTERDLEDGAIFATQLVHEEDGQYLLAAGNYARRVRMWRLQMLQQGQGILKPPQLLWESDQHTGWVRSLALATSKRGEGSS